MRKIKDNQGWLEFQSSNLMVTNAYYAKYEAISGLLDRTPKLLELVHQDLEEALRVENRESERRGGFVYTSEMVLRLTLCQVLEGASLRGIVVRVDDSHCLRRFTRIHEGPMMGHTALCQLRNAIAPETWAAINQALAEAAVEHAEITGEKLRLDTTAVETNIHYPTDSSLLWDGYRTLDRLIRETREVFASSVGNRRSHLAPIKRLATLIARKGRGKGRKAKDLKRLYSRLIAAVDGICGWSEQIAFDLELESRRVRSPEMAAWMERLVDEFRHYVPLIRRVIWQTSERVVHDRPVENDAKLFSIFEEHTELLIRGKAGKSVEFGHMLQIQQTGEKFITDYTIFEKKPAEPALVRPALESHRELFGHFPEILAGDKGYWSGPEFEGLAKDVAVVSLPKKGSRTQAEKEREHDSLFRLAQAFRAGVEGSISFLKRILSLGRCMRKGWKYYSATVGSTVFAHNLLVLTRC